MKIYTGYIDAVSHPFPEALNRTELVNDWLESSHPGLRNYISRMLLPAMGGIIKKEARRVALLRAAQTAIAIERFRLAHDGARPDSLDQLTPVFLPSILDDPFDGQPLRYRQLDTGYVVYSIDDDLEDNDGDLEPKTRQPKDQRFRVFR